MDSVVAFNNQGVYFYEIGDLEEASACFRDAAVRIGSIRERLTANRSASSLSNNYDPIRGWSKPTRTEASEEGHSIIFSRILLLNDFDCPCSENASPTMPSFSDIDALALVVLYNSAVLNHFHSDSRGEISTSTEAAYQGYEQTFIISKNLPCNIGNSFSFHLKVLEMALFNNMGVLYHNNFARFRDAVQCFKSSRKKMNLVEDQLICNNLVTANELQQLSLNILVVPVGTAPVA